MKKVIIGIIVVLLVAAIGVGGWYLIDSLKKSNDKVEKLENRITKMEENKVSTNNTTNTTNVSNETVTNTNATTTNTTNTNKEDQKSNISLNGTYTRADETRRTTGTLKIENYTDESFEFDINTSHINGMDIDAAIERGAVNIGGTKGVAKKISNGVFQFVPDVDDELMSYWEGEYKITFTVKSNNSIELEETYDKTNHSQGPYGGHNVWFDGTYVKE